MPHAVPHQRNVSAGGVNGAVRKNNLDAEIAGHVRAKAEELGVRY
jgi:hypothetical protein